MPFDPNFPADDAIAYADEQRAQFNALHDEITSIPQGPPWPAGEKGDKGDAGDVGAQGPAGEAGRSVNPRGEWNDAETYNRLDQVTYSGLFYQCNADGTSMATPGTDPRWDLLAIVAPPAFPHEGDAQIGGNLLTGGNEYVQGELGLGIGDAGGSGESGLKIRAVNPGDGHIPEFAGRSGGADQYAFSIDGAGVTGNMGQPTVQDGDLLSANTSGGRAMFRPIRSIASRFADLMPLNISDPNPNIQALGERLDTLLARLQGI